MIISQFGLALQDVGDFKKFEAYDKLYQREISTSSNFNRASAKYKKEGATPSAKKLIQIAVNSNGYVLAKLNSKIRSTTLLHLKRLEVKRKQWSIPFSSKEFGKRPNEH